MNARAAGVRLPPKKTGASQSNSADSDSVSWQVDGATEGTEAPGDAGTLSLASVIHEIRHTLTVPPERALWDIEDLCRYFKVGRTSAYREIICKPAFPKPVEVGKRRRWIAGEVMAWTAKQR